MILTFSYFALDSWSNDCGKQKEVNWIFPGIMFPARYTWFARYSAKNSLESWTNMDLVLYSLTYPRLAGLVQCLQLHSHDSLDNYGLSTVPLIINSNMKSKHISSHSTDCIIISLTQVQTLCAQLLQRSIQLNVLLLNSLFTKNINGSW